MSPAPVRSARIACLGGAVVDATYRGTGPLIDGTSNPVAGWHGIGGVARNVAESLARLGHAVSLHSLVGDDVAGQEVRGQAQGTGIGVEGLSTAAGRNTARYLAILEPDGNLKLGLADMAIFEAMTPSWLEERRPLLASADCVFADCNLPADTLAALIASRPPRLAIDGVSVAKCQRLPAVLAGVDTLFVNRDEAAALSGLPAATDALELARRLAGRGAGEVVVTAGGDGVAFAGAEGEGRVAATATRIVDVTGAGDALIAGTLAARLTGANRSQSLMVGTHLAARTIEHAARVRPDIAAMFAQAWAAALSKSASKD